MPPSAIDAEGRVDLATAQRLVEAAVVQATRKPDKSGLVVQASVAQATRRGARINALLAAGVLITLSALVMAVVIVVRSRRAASVLVTEAGLDGDAKTIAAPTGTVPTKVLSGREIYEQNRGSLYVLAYVHGRKIGGCCSAFAIDARTLVTNAHCVTSCGKSGGKPVVVLNDSQGKTKLDVITQKAHPGYLVDSKSANSPDVALLRISGAMSQFVTVASDAELRSMGPGDDVYVLGFPGRVMDPVSPSATFLNGHIGRVMGFDEQATTPDKTALVLHDAVTRGGNSGSPVFNQYGHVIAVHAAHVDDEEELSIGGTKTKVVQSSPFRLAMRIDLIRGVPAQ
jgi:S1-C subfamily serine protease